MILLIFWFTFKLFHNVYMIHKIPCNIYIKVFMKPNIKKLFLPKNKMATNKQFKQSLKYLGGIIFHGLEYLIGHEVVFCFIF